MAIVVLPRIEVDNPFREVMEILGNEAIPMIRQLAMNKEQIAKLSDTELTDHIPVLKQFAPELLTQDGKIDWNKVEEYLKSDDLFKQEVANYLINTRRRREEFRNLPIGAKLEQLDFYGAKTNPQILKKEFMRYTILNKYQEAINNSNLPEDAKLFLLAHAPQFAELTVKNPAYFSAFLNILSKHSKKQDKNETKQEGGTGGWRLSLDEQGRRGFGIRLEEPQITPPQITPPQIPKIAGQKPVVKQGGGGDVKQEVKTKQTPQSQQTSDSNIQKIYIDGVEYTVRPKKGGGYEVLSVREVPLQEPLVFDPSLWLSGLLGKAVSKAGGVVGKVKNIFSRTPKPASQQVAENVAKETAENVASQQVKAEAQNVVGQASKYDERRRQVAEKIREQMRQKTQNVNEPQKLPIPAPKETRWEFANAKPPAIVFREGRMIDYTPPQFERVSTTRLQELARQKKLPTTKGETAITLKPKETPYKEAVAQQGFKTSQILEEFLKKTQPPKVETKEAVFKPIKKLENLVKEIPEEAKNNPEIRRRLVEITRDLKKISSEAPFRDVSDDLRVLDAKVDELKALLRKQYGGTKTTTEKPTPQPKKKKSNK